MSDERKYCVYLHKDELNVIRYVGQGTINRSKSVSDRNKNWKIIFKNKKPTVEIVKNSLTKSEALQLESELILKYQDTIVNSLTSTNIAKKIDIEYLKNIVYYCSKSKTGLRYCKTDYSGIHGNAVSRLEGSEAGSIDKNGYWSVKINNITYKNHRIIVLLHGINLNEDLVVNHKNCNPSNNNIDNLQVCTIFENNRKKKYHVRNCLHVLNNTGETGITQRKVGGIDYLIYTISFKSDRKQFTISLRNCDYDTALNCLKNFKYNVNLILDESDVFDKEQFNLLFKEYKSKYNIGS